VLSAAKALHLQKPTQIVWPTVWDDHARIPRKLKQTMRKVQDPATRAWNLLNAIFYKAGRAPWRLSRPDDQLMTSYVGIGFYRDLSGQKLLTSTAQMFDERGKGLILRGGRACIDKGDRHPYLDREEAYDLLRRSLKEYRGQHHHYPARIALLKTSRFEKGEADGFREALKEHNIAYSDLVWISESSPVTRYREGDYPPLRGTMIGFDKDALLFTRGSVPIYRTYPGMRVPRPILIRPQVLDTPMRNVAQDMLALTKMNWNTTQFDGALPIPIRAARQVGKVLRHVPVGQREASEYPGRHHAGCAGRSTRINNPENDAPSIVEPINFVPDAGISRRKEGGRLSALRPFACGERPPRSRPEPRRGAAVSKADSAAVGVSPIDP
jgi:hypothetical protein